MRFNCLPSNHEGLEELGTDLENIVEIEISIFEREPEIDSIDEDLPDYLLLRDDYLQKEQERQKQENLNKILPTRIP